MYGLAPREYGMHGLLNYSANDGLVGSCLEESFRPSFWS